VPVAAAIASTARLVYLPRYCAPDAPEHDEPDELVMERFTGFLRRMAPGFEPAGVVDWSVQRARVTEPVHALGARPRVAPIWPGVPGLALASTAQVYPRLLNGDSVIGLAEDVAAGAIARLRAG
jgi:protoporphyrinogen oxidase